MEKPGCCGRGIFSGLTGHVSLPGYADPYWQIYGGCERDWGSDAKVPAGQGSDKVQAAEKSKSQCFLCRRWRRETRKSHKVSSLTHTGSNLRLHIYGLFTWRDCWRINTRPGTGKRHYFREGEARGSTTAPLKKDSTINWRIPCGNICIWRTFMECSEKPIFHNYTRQELAQIRITAPEEAVRSLVKKHWDTPGKTVGRHG